MSNPLTNFTVTAQTRHPRTHKGYDARTHGYLAGYVRPSSWRLTLDACAQIPTETVVDPPSPTEDGGDHKPVITELPVFPPDFERYEWTVERVPSGFKNVFGTLAAGPSCKATVDVPSPGTYKITLTIRMRGGSFLRSDPVTYRLRDALVVSLGESAASGQGNPDERGEPTLLGSGQCEFTTLSMIAEGLVGVSMERDPTWQEPLAYRSYQSGPSRAALAARGPQSRQSGDLPVVRVERCRDRDRPVRAATRLPGRRTDRGGQANRRRPQDRRTAPVDGGNDVGFGPGLKDLVKDFMGQGQDATFAEINTKIAQLPQKYLRLAERIEDRLNPRKVYITEYPTAFFDRSDGTPGGGCGIFDSSFELDISAEDGRRIRDAGRRLNAAVRQAADRHGWVFVDGIEAGFAGHGYCSDNSFFVFAEDSCRQQGNFEGTMHPNAAGHAVYSRRLQAALARRLFPRVLVPTTPQQDPDDDVVIGAAQS